MMKSNTLENCTIIIRRFNVEDHLRGGPTISDLYRYEIHFYKSGRELSGILTMDHCTFENLKCTVNNFDLERNI